MVFGGHIPGLGPSFPPRWVELFRGAHDEAGPILRKLESSDLPLGLWRFEVRRETQGGATEVVISVIEPVERRARQVLLS